MSITKLLDSKLDNGEIISVFCNPEDNYSAVVGFLTAVDETHFVLNHITKYGRYDGYVLRIKDNLFRFDEKTSYETSLKKLYDYYGDKHIDYKVDGSVLVWFLNFAKSNKFILGIGVKDHDQVSIYGYVESINQEIETVSIHQTTEDGVFDGYITLSFDSLMRIACDCQMEQAIKVLNSLHANGGA